MIRSLFVKLESGDPGRPLTHDEAPDLWNLARAVAETAGTRPVDEIRVTPGTDVAVYEKGSFRERERPSHEDPHYRRTRAVGVRTTQVPGKVGARPWSLFKC